MKKLLVLDLETVLDPEVPPTSVKPKRLIRTMERDPFLVAEPVNLQSWKETIVEETPFPPPPCWKIACVGVGIFEDYQVKELACFTGTEEENLKELAWLLSETKRLDVEGRELRFPEHVLVTFNGRHFDMPVVLARAARHGLSLPFWSGKRALYRFSEEYHLDLLDVWTNHGASPRPSLSQMARLVGLPGKREGETGSQVEAMLREGKKAEVAAYCLADVVQTAGVLLRTELLRGKLHRDLYKKSAMRLLEACEGAFGQGFEWVSEKTNRRVFLLEDLENAP